LQDDMAKKERTAGRRKRLPVHPGEIISGILEDCRVSQRTAATAMGVSHNALALWSAARPESLPTWP
jgi:DNA-binding transcriptional regulator YiaG